MEFALKHIRPQMTEEERTRLLSLIGDDLRELWEKARALDAKLLSAKDPWVYTRGLGWATLALGEGFSNCHAMVVGWQGVEGEGTGRKAIPHSTSAFFGKLETVQQAIYGLMLLLEASAVAATEAEAFRMQIFDPLWQHLNDKGLETMALVAGLPKEEVERRMKEIINAELLSRADQPQPDEAVGKSLESNQA